MRSRASTSRSRARSQTAIANIPESADGKSRLLLVDMRDHGRVARSRHVVAARGEVAPYVGEVVELAVEDGDDVLGLVGRGLVAGLEVDDAQPAMPEDAATEERDASRVGPAMEERLGHAPDDVRVGRSGGRY